MPVTTLERDRQPLPWQSTAWAKSWNRRSRIEGLNGLTRYLDVNLNRGFIRCRGRAATGLLTAFALLGMNVRRLHKWHTTHELDDPGGWSSTRSQMIGRSTTTTAPTDEPAAPAPVRSRVPIHRLIPLCSNLLHYCPARALRQPERVLARVQPRLTGRASTSRTGREQHGPPVPRP
ncbi:hypothetical protein MWU75_14870 [Ornithinimicrobium sp. F0845]|uniref:hypothetical protein n=1 Tax=Ornithinimicrobium sp. F0845 TaxID=2926412 RepID=UPI001FF4DF30|nr:hypothetical protein [Ornithinimicrobium sp. F0845]MCK0113430.1 hypothetical protein [Ornithinimicrobium sp. F0845]